MPLSKALKTMENLTPYSGLAETGGKEAKNIKSLVPDFLLEQDISPSSRKTYKTALDGFFTYLMESGTECPTRTDLIRYKEELYKNHTAKTVNLRLSVIRNFFKWTHFYGIYPDISFGVKGVRDGKEPKRQPLTSSQVRSILDNMDTSTLCGRQKYAMVLLSSTTGLRASEMSSLNVGDLFAVRDHFVLSVKGKGRIDKGQMVAVGDSTEEAIRSALSLRGSVSPEDPLFVSTSNHNHGERITPKGISRLLKNVLIDNNFTGKFYTGHSFRHTACCLGLEVTGHDLVGVKRFMRHANIETTMVYADHGEAISSSISTDIEERIKPGK